MPVDLELQARVDAEARKLLDDFVPDKVFDTHAHILRKPLDPHNYPDTPFEYFDWECYLQDMQALLPGRVVHANMLPSVQKYLADNPDLRNDSDAFTVAQLEKDPLSVGSIVVIPGDTAEGLEKRLTHPRLKGIKCYYSFAGQGENDPNADPEAFLPEGAWELANQKGMTITLHLTKPHAIADPHNIQYVRTMAKRYPHAILILAHAARSYADWPAVEAAQYIADLDNVWVDLSAIFSSPPAFQLIKKLGVGHCMWGTDFPGPCRARTVCVTVARKQCWLKQETLAAAGALSWNIGTQTLMAIRQAAIMADLTPSQIEDIFYNNAMTLFHSK